MPERALTTIDIAAQFAAKARAQTAVEREREQGERAEQDVPRPGHRGASQDDLEADRRSPLSGYSVLSDAQLAEIGEMIAGLERQRQALSTSVAAFVERLTLAGAAERLNGVDPEAIDRILADLLGRLVAMLAPDLEAAAQRQGRPLDETEQALLGGSQEWRALAELLGRLR